MRVRRVIGNRLLCANPAFSTPLLLISQFIRDIDTIRTFEVTSAHLYQLDEFADLQAIKDHKPNTYNASQLV
jgi:hypothetical protein